jgi:phenylalanyl-tRNA synthetase beta chain
MPKIEIYKTDLDNLCRHRFTAKELERNLTFAKAEVEERDGSGKIKIDCKDTNRPDLWCVEGISRQLRGILGIETGIPRYDLHKGATILEVDKKVAKVRPAIVGAVIRGMNFNDRIIEQTIQLQEKIALTYGRKRSQAAIGIYDWSKIIPPIKYTTFKDSEISFVPLEFDRQMSPKEILAEHPKGREYGHLIPGEDFPILIDSAGNVLSMPPIINSAITGKITNATKDVFVEVTGYNLRLISTALNVIVTSLAERGGKIETITIVYPKGRIVCPDFRERSTILDPNECRKILGLEISDKEIVKLLLAMRYDAKIKDRKIVCSWPAWRNDIMSARDIIEDVAIAFGYNEIEPIIPELPTAGKELPIESWCEKVKEICIGLGLQEVLTFVMTNQDNLFRKMCISQGQVATIANPMSERWTCLRNAILPGLLDFLTKNAHVDYPQQIFEIGDCVVIDEKTETRTKDVRKLGIVKIDSKIGYQNISSIVSSLMQELGLEYLFEPFEHPSFVSGRCAKIIVDKKSVGIAGEIHPQVLNNWGLEKPVVGLELDLCTIWEIKYGRYKFC